MTNSEKAWETVNHRWHPYGQHRKDESEARKRLRDAIGQLQSMRLPIRAVDQITIALDASYQAALEESFCPECGIRGDETDECSRCKMRVDVGEMDTISGLCQECQSEDDAEEDGL